METNNCTQCGALMKSRRECDYCGTVFYRGPELPDRLPHDGPMGVGVLSSGQSFQTCAMRYFQTGNGWWDSVDNRYVSEGQIKQLGASHG